MVKLVGREAYVRWMDDHVIGVNSEAQGLRVLAAMQDSLASLYLTPNAKKSLVLSLAEAKIHFHLDTNADLDGLESKVATRAARRVALVRELTRAWRLAGQGPVGTDTEPYLQARGHYQGALPSAARDLRSPPES